MQKNDFKGEPIYIGGDDIFAIMPLAFKDKDGVKTVLDFAKRINEVYNNEVANKIPVDNESKPGNQEKTSLSGGIVAAYYKFPLAIALEEVKKQLFNVAKNMPEKNGLAVKFIQHSGAESSFNVRFDNPILGKLNNLYSSVLSSEKGFPAVHHKIERFKPLLTNLKYDYQLVNLLEKRFYEGFENDKQKELFKELMTDTLIKPVNGGLKILTGKEAEDSLKDLGDMLHILKFIKGEK